jgi:TPR repeat protein
MKSALAILFALCVVGCENKEEAEKSSTGLERSISGSTAPAYDFNKTRELAEQQDALGWMYSEGNGVDQDFKESVKWFRKAAEQGYANAQNRLGYKYDIGEGVPRDDKEAVKWYRKSAEQGHPMAQSNMGNMYLTGAGVPKDDEEAVKWYRKAAEQGLAPAQFNLGLAYDKGDGAQALGSARGNSGHRYLPRQRRRQLHHRQHARRRWRMDGAVTRTNPAGTPSN